MKFNMIYRLVSGAILILIGAILLLTTVDKSISHFCFLGGIISEGYFLLAYFLNRKIKNRGQTLWIRILHFQNLYTIPSRKYKSRRYFQWPVGREYIRYYLRQGSDRNRFRLRGCNLFLTVPFRHLRRPEWAAFRCSHV